MQRIEDIKYTVFKAHKLVGTKSTQSFTLDTLGMHTILVAIQKGSIAQATGVNLRHSSSSTASYGESTAFTSGGSIVSAATACLNYAAIFEGQTAMKRYLKIQLSKQAACNAVTITTIGFCNRAIPSNSVLGATAPAGFTSLTRPVV